MSNARAEHWRSYKKFKKPRLLDVFDSPAILLRTKAAHFTLLCQSGIHTSADEMHII